MAKVELTPAKLAELKQKAEAAEDCSPSPWVFKEMPSVKGEVRDSENFQVAGWFILGWQAEHIAAADPATVLALVEEIELLKKRLSWFPAHIMEKINLAILSHTGGMADPCKEHCRCDDSVGYYCEYCAVYDALISCKQATESEAGQ